MKGSVDGPGASDQRSPAAEPSVGADAVRGLRDAACTSASGESATVRRRCAPTAGRTVRLSTHAMASEFSVILNPDGGEQLRVASEALDLVHVLEDQMSVFREWSELSRLNRTAAREPVVVEPSLFDLLVRAAELAERTGGAFDPTAGPLVELWRWCRRQGRIPTQEEIDWVKERVGHWLVEYDRTARTVRFTREGVQLNLGAIGKGYAVDRVGEHLAAGGVTDWLVHGGHSSVLARGRHNGLSGWPVGLRHPLFPRKRLGTLLLRDAAFSTSGSGVQFFRHQGRKYGHILDPRTGWPAEGLLSVTVIATTAAEADALSTALYVAGLEKALQIWNNSRQVSAVLVPPPTRNRQLRPIVCGVPEELLFFADEQVRPVRAEEWLEGGRTSEV